MPSLHPSHYRTTQACNHLTLSKVTIDVGMQGMPSRSSTIRCAAGSAWAGSSTSLVPRHARPWPAAKAPVAPAPGSPPAPGQRQLCTAAASTTRPPALHRQPPRAEHERQQPDSHTSPPFPPHCVRLCARSFLPRSRPSPPSSTHPASTTAGSGPEEDERPPSPPASSWARAEPGGGGIGRR